MSDVDRITDDGKRAIVSILNKGLAVEYTHIVNYPRFIDQMVNIDRVPDDDPCVVVLKRLGEESVRHANIVMHLITLLDGEPHLVVEPVERISDVFGMCQKQMEKEKENLLLFQQAKAVVQKNQMKTLKGILDANINMIRNRPSDTVKTSQMIQLLTRLENDESRHMQLLDTVISDLIQHRNKSDD